MRFRDSHLGDLLGKIRGELQHLRNMRNYRAFYERQ